ncbi:hypothetical protein Tco_0099840 [Tanacetum coccineum]
MVASSHEARCRSHSKKLARTNLILDRSGILWDCKFACCSSEEQKDAIRYPYSWVLVHSRQPDDIYCGVTMLKAEPKTKCTLVDSAATPVEFVTGMLSATTSRSSYPTWGIEKVPNWMRPVTLKESIQLTTQIDAIDLCVFTASAAVGYMLAYVFCRQK